MLDKTEKKLESYFKNEPQLGADGQIHEMDGKTRINRPQCDALAELHAKLRPDLSIEAGLAYGFSTLPILDAMESNGYGHHIAIDPGQTALWNGIALASVQQLGFSNRFTWLDSRSDRALVKMASEGKRAQFVYLDGLHSFDGILTDFFLAEQILDVGAIAVFNQKWMPVGRAIASFISNNMTHYEPVTLDDNIIFAFRKVGHDKRGWDHFVSFDGSGSDRSSGNNRVGFLRGVFGR